MKTVAIIQARMGSTRLPGKVLEDLAGQPMLARVVRRVERARTVDEVVVATSTSDRDTPLTQLAAANGWPVFRGSELDVLDRFYGAAQTHGADVVVRITADCPLVDPQLIDRTVETYLRRPGTLSYCSTVLPPRTYPRGLDVEAFGSDVLAQTWRECRVAAWREHVTPYMYAQPDRFTVAGVFHTRDCSDIRWTVDTHEDLICVRRLYEIFGHDEFTWQEALWLVEQQPALKQLNRHVRQRTVPGLPEAA